MDWHTDGVKSNSTQLWIDRLPSIGETSNKYTRGHAVVFGGYPMTGAARLAARACARIGAGLTTIFVEDRALDAYAVHLESIMVRGMVDESGLASALNDERITSILAGPGLGVSPRTRRVVRAILETRRPAVLDADALTSFSEEPGELFGLLHPKCVITPHEGEFSRIFSLSGSRETRALDAARQCNAVVVLKGSQTVVTTPAGEVVVNPTASPHLATAGSGDVLAGIITGLLAQGMASLDAACAGVWVHSEIGRHLGIGMIADDMPEDIPRVRRLLEKD